MKEDEKPPFFGWTSESRSRWTKVETRGAAEKLHKVVMTFSFYDPWYAEPFNNDTKMFTNVGPRWVFGVNDRILDDTIDGSAGIDNPPFEKAEESRLKYFRNGLLTTRKHPDRNDIEQVLTGAGWKDMQ